MPLAGRAAGGEGVSRGARASAAPASCHSHIAAMQLFHELKQQFPALPDDAISACIAKHCQNPTICHEQLSLAAAPRSITYPDCLRNDERRLSNLSSDQLTKMNFSTKFNPSDDTRKLSNTSSDDLDDFKLTYLNDFENLTSISKINSRLYHSEEKLSEDIQSPKLSQFSNKNHKIHIKNEFHQQNEHLKTENISSNDYTSLTSHKMRRSRNLSPRLLDFKRLTLEEEDFKLSNTSSSDEFPIHSRKSSSKKHFIKKLSMRSRSSSPKLSKSKSPRNEEPNRRYPSTSTSKMNNNCEEETNKSSKIRSSPSKSIENCIPPESPQSVVSERTSFPHLSDFPSDPRDFSDFSPRTKPPISPLTSKRPPGRATKTYDARITKLPENNPQNTGAVKRTPAVRPASLDLPKKTSDSVDNGMNPVQQGVNLSVNVNCSMEGNSSGSRRHSAVLEVTPEPTWLHSPSYPPSPRSYTSVNLTLRTPTTPSSGPIDICSSPSPASLTYTTSSWDRRQGLQSRLEITVGPAAGCVTAMRTRPRSSCFLEEEREDRRQRAESMPDLSGRVEQTTNCVVLVARQKDRKNQLQNELIVGKERLYEIQKEIQALKIEYTPEFKIRLEKEIRHLQAQCERLTSEVDRHSESRVPLGETNEEFYRHIYTGQRHPSQRRRVAPSRIPTPAVTDPDNEPRWPCHICTFRNHPLMDKCEQCEMPRVLLVSTGPGENIHIRFSPGNTTRVIHSWVV